AMDKREPPYYNSEESPYVSYSFPFYETMEVLIETLTGTFFEIRVSPFESVMSVKAKIQRLEGIPITQQHLIWRNIELEDDYCLHDYHITHGCTIKLVLAMRGGPINTRKVAVEDPAVREMAEYMEENREELLDKLPANKQVTLLVFREGDQLNFFRVVERSDGTLTPLSESLSGGSMYNLYAEEEEEDAEESPSVEQLQENALTMSKMSMLRNHMSLAKKPKKGIPKLQPRPPSSLRSIGGICASRSRQRLRAFPQLSQSPGRPHCLPPLCGSNAESSEQPTASMHLPGSPVTRVPSRTVPPPPTVLTTNPLAFCSPYINGISSVMPEGGPHLTSSLLTTGVFAGGFHPAVGQVSGGQRARAPTTDHQKAAATTGHATILSSFSPLPAISNGAALFSGGNFAANALTGAAFDAIVRSEGLRGATGGSLKTLAEPASRAGWCRQECNGSAPSAISSASVNSQAAVTFQRSSRCAAARVHADGSPQMHHRSLAWLNLPAWANLPRLHPYSSVDHTTIGNDRCVCVQALNGSPSLVAVSRGPVMLTNAHPVTCNGAEFIARFSQRTSSRTRSLLLPPLPVFLPAGHRASLPRHVHAPVPPTFPKKKAATKRCFFCGRKTGLATSYECRCGNNFCGMHRYAEAHACTFDYKSIGRRLLLDSHPAISAPKLPKI
uniref:Zinc finger, AN1-type domain 4 n=1 Tax=Petromyzon marinus TaxID=7757 RepID=S4RR10_PETMA